MPSAYLPWGVRRMLSDKDKSSKMLACGRSRLDKKLHKEAALFLSHCLFVWLRVGDNVMVEIWVSLPSVAVCSSWYNVLYNQLGRVTYTIGRDSGT